MMALWPRAGAARCLRSHSHLVSSRFWRKDDIRRGSVGVVANASTRASPDYSGSASISPEHWKAVYRTFLLHVHPDFFHDQPKERAVNEKSLKVLSMHLNALGDRPASNSACLVFFFKTTTTMAVNYTAQHNHNNDVQGYAGVEHKDEQPLPRKVMLPIASDRNSTKVEVRHLLNVAGVSPTPVPPPPLSTQASPSRHHKPRGSPTSSSEDGTDWNEWVEDLFGDTPANRAWDEAAARASRRRMQDEDTTSEGRQRTTWGGAASEQYDHSGGAGLGRVLATDAGRALVRERRVSARNVRRLVEELREKHGFGKCTFRCGWSKSNLVVALSSLLKECDAHREAFRVPNFGGLDVVFREDPSVLHKGEIRLCPADVPVQWISVLRGVTPALLSEVEERSREVSLLEKEASALLGRTRLSRGLSCSKSRYHEFLGDICMAGADLGPEGETAVDLSRGDWSLLQCRVEEGFSRVSVVLDDGTIQIGSDMTLQTVRRCLEKDLACSSAAATETARLAATVAVATDRCRQSLGLEAIDRARSVSVGQMAAACEALVRLGRGEDGDVAGEAAAARRRLRGHIVRVVGARRGVFDGVTDEGEIAVPWNWAEEEEQERGGASADARSSSPFC